MQKLLVLGGKPIASVAIVKYAKSVGAYVIVADNLTPEQSPAKQIADEHWNISTADVELLALEVQKHQVTALFTGAHEFNIARCIELAELTGLYFYLSKAQFVNTSNKAIYKEVFKKYDVPVVNEYSLKQVQENKNIRFPVVLKPVDASGGYGIQICNSTEEVVDKYKEALGFSEAKKVIIEEYITANEISIFYFIENAKVHLLSVADRHKEIRQDKEVALPIGYVFPSVHLTKFQNNLDDKLKQALTSFEVKDGMFFLQAFATDNEILIYDIGCRITGTQEYQLFEKLYGFNTLHQMIDKSLNRNSQNFTSFGLEADLSGKYASILTFIARPGVISEFKGLSQLNDIKEVISVIKNHQEGHEIPMHALHTLNQVVLRVYLMANSLQDLKKVIEKINSVVNVVDQNGTSLIQHYFSTERIA